MCLVDKRVFHRDLHSVACGMHIDIRRELVFLYFLRISKLLAMEHFNMLYTANSVGTQPDAWGKTEAATSAL